MRIRVVVEQNHLSELLPLVAVLQEAGHELVAGPPADLFLVDTDVPMFGYREAIDAYAESGAIVLQYPHGAAPDVQYDGLYEPYEKVHGYLALSNGNAEVWQRLGITRPTRTLGWFYCEQAPFRACRDIQKVLFAPTHPNGDGSLLPERAEANARYLRKLCASSWEVTVRYLGENPEQSGVPIVRGVNYIRGAMDLSVEEIDATDVVVAGFGTFPLLAVARGKPTVTYGQDQLSVFGVESDILHRPSRRALYEDLVRYPFDAGDNPLVEVVQAAARDDGSIATWRRRWIGDQFDPSSAAGAIEDFVAELGRAQVTM